MIQNAIQLLMSIYLCDPAYRRRLIAAASRLCRSRAKVSAKKLSTIDSAVGDQNGEKAQTYDEAEIVVETGKPELACMIASLLSTVLIAAVIFAIGMRN